MPSKRLPLLGKTIVITRYAGASPRLGEALRRKGARVIPHPVMAVRPLPPMVLDAALSTLHSYDWVVFTSGNAVRVFFDRMRRRGIDTHTLCRARLAAVGEKTAAALRKRGLRVELVPKKFVAESLVAAFRKEKTRGKRVLIPRAKKAREILPRELRRMGAVVDDIPIYDTVPVAPPRRKILWERVDAIVFTSGSTVNYLVAAYKDAPPWNKSVLAACIGPVTARAAKRHFKRVLAAPEHTMAGMALALAEHFKMASFARFRYHAPFSK